MSSRSHVRVYQNKRLCEIFTNVAFFRINDETDVSVPGALKLDQLQSVEPILFQNFFNFGLSYWGSNSYYPEG